MLESPLNAKREALKLVLQMRFGPLPADLKQRIDAVTDLDKADKLLLAAAVAKTLEDFKV